MESTTGQGYINQPGNGNQVLIFVRDYNPATNICCHCIYDGDGWLCDACLDKHECGEEMFLPVVNSPRVGVCAFEGGCYD